MYGIAAARTSHVRTASGSKTITAKRTAAARAPSGSPARAMERVPARMQRGGGQGQREGVGGHPAGGYRTSVRIALAWRATAAAVIGPSGELDGERRPAREVAVLPSRGGRRRGSG